MGSSVAELEKELNEGQRRLYQQGEEMRTLRAQLAKAEKEAKLWEENHDAVVWSRDGVREQLAQAQEEVQRYQVDGGYTKGHEHGTLTAARFKSERDEAREKLAQVQREAGGTKALLVEAVALLDDAPSPEYADEWDAFYAARWEFGKKMDALSSDAGKGYHHESECQARAGAAVREDRRVFQAYFKKMTGEGYVHLSTMPDDLKREWLEGYETAMLDAAQSLRGDE